MVKPETSDIQGIITSGYKHLAFSKYLFLQVDDVFKFKTWLKDIIPDITTANHTKFVCVPAINLAFTHAGLKKLGLPSKEWEIFLDTFPTEFIEGMSTFSRSRQLGDMGSDAPEHWEKPWRRTALDKNNHEIAEERIHLLLILQAPNQDLLNRYCEGHLQHFPYSDQPSLDTAGRTIDIQTGYMYKPSNAAPGNLESASDRQMREHFGFRDSISQPAIRGIEKGRQVDPDAIAAGEFILGYPNELSTSSKPLYPPTPVVASCLDQDECLKVENDHYQNNYFKTSHFRDFGRNGSYLVFRKLEQHVEAFQTYFSQFGEKQKLMEAKVVGRWHSGVPLTLSSDRDPLEDDTKPLNDWKNFNDFSYTDTDSHGYGCPIGSHIRRANPRDAMGDNPQNSIEAVKRHRIIRRGALYDDGDSKGLLFFCINADIRRQFEFIQQNWIQSPNFNSMHGEIDPLIGKNPDDSPRDMTIQKQPIRQKIQGLPTFVTVKAGGYFFLPSIRALNFLAKLQGDTCS